MAEEPKEENQPRVIEITNSNVLEVVREGEVGNTTVFKIRDQGSQIKEVKKIEDGESKTVLKITGEPTAEVIEDNRKRRVIRIKG
jgi:6-phosphogluconolactonase (cycloisomerase 2 family)